MFASLPSLIHKKPVKVEDNMKAKEEGRALKTVIFAILYSHEVSAGQPRHSSHGPGITFDKPSDSNL